MFPPTRRSSADISRSVEEGNHPTPHDLLIPAESAGSGSKRKRKRANANAIKRKRTLNPALALLARVAVDDSATARSQLTPGTRVFARSAGAAERGGPWSTRPTDRAAKLGVIRTRGMGVHSPATSPGVPSEHSRCVSSRHQARISHWKGMNRDLANTGSRPTRLTHHAVVAVAVATVTAHTEPTLSPPTHLLISADLQSRATTRLRRAAEISSECGAGCAQPLRTYRSDVRAEGVAKRNRLMVCAFCLQPPRSIGGRSWGGARCVLLQQHTRQISPSN